VATHSRLASPASTLAVLKANDLYTKKSLGQHFLVDDNVVGRILELAALSGTEAVLEIGPGIGTLTVALCSKAGQVVAVERDDRLIPILKRLQAESGNLIVVHSDALKVDVAGLMTPAGPPTTLVANLPYNIAATVLLDLFLEVPTLRSAVVMVQSEVADRIAASPGSKQYGAYTVKLGFLARPAGRFQVPRSCFMPPPNVDSSVIRLERVGSSADIADLESIFAAVQAAFSHRRKTLRNSLRAGLSADIAHIDEALTASGIDGNLRAETLGTDDFVELARALAEYRLLP